VVEQLVPRDPVDPSDRRSDAFVFLQLGDGGEYSTGITAPRAWIDRAVGRNADVTLVYTGDNPYRGWENEFWNRSVRHVYDLGAPAPNEGWDMDLDVHFFGCWRRPDRPFAGVSLLDELNVVATACTGPSPINRSDPSCRATNI
jgi:hypothetical protein